MERTVVVKQKRSSPAFVTFIVFCSFIFLLVLGSVVAAQLIFNVNFGLPVLLERTYVTYTKLGKNGRVGNQLFQIAAAIGLAAYLRKDVRLPRIKLHDTLFEEQGNPTVYVEDDAVLKSSSLVPIYEANCFVFQDNINQEFVPNSHIDLQGYRQNPRYFHSVISSIRRAFQIKLSLLALVQVKLQMLLQEYHENVVWMGVHIRRGDYVGHNMHEVCTLQYYRTAISILASLQKTVAIVLISDDKKWCENNIDQLVPIAVNNVGVFVSPFTTWEEDFACLFTCPLKVLSNSTFAWWAAFLDARYNSRVILPKPWIRKVSPENYEEGDYQDMMMHRDPRWECIPVDKATVNIMDSPNQIVRIGAYYQCYKQPHAFINACFHFRQVYSDTTLVVVSDAGEDFERVSLDVFGAKSYTTNPVRNGNGNTTFIDSLEKIILFLENFIQGAKQMEEEYFILLEDDIFQQRAVCLEMSKLRYFDLIGNNNITASFNTETAAKMRAYTTSSYYGGCGGSLFRTKFWAGLNVSKIREQVQWFGNLNNHKFHSDMVLSAICLLNLGKIGCGQQLFPTEFAERPPSFGSTTYPAILHMYKELYNQPLTQWEKAALEGSQQNQAAAAEANDEVDEVDEVDE